MKVALLLLMAFAALAPATKAQQASEETSDIDSLYVLNESQTHTVVPLQSPISDPSNEWSMSAVITER